MTAQATKFQNLGQRSHNNVMFWLCMRPECGDQIGLHIVRHVHQHDPTPGFRFVTWDPVSISRDKKCRIASSSLTLCMTHVGQITWLGCMSICLNMFLTLMCLTLLSKCVPSKKYWLHLHSSSRILLFISRSNFGSRASSY